MLRLFHFNRFTVHGSRFTVHEYNFNSPNTFSLFDDHLTPRISDPGTVLFLFPYEED